MKPLLPAIPTLSENLLTRIVYIQVIPWMAFLISFKAIINH